MRSATRDTPYLEDEEFVTRRRVDQAEEVIRSGGTIRQASIDCTPASEGRCRMIAIPEHVAYSKSPGDYPPEFCLDGRERARAAYDLAVQLWYDNRHVQAVVVARGALEACCRYLADQNVEEGERRPRTFGGALCMLKRKGLLTSPMKHEFNHQYAVASKAAHGDPITYQHAGRMMRFVGVLVRSVLDREEEVAS